ncbi:hypothetical protein CYMTET_24649 [Cymbomonas tetramitiformis]|uniref:Uncharacterized protein n=1 Tax=Cymbomonas tetramitiformis TaxID=36881 RepID=A0AAE0FVQ4_9CHLO|nr:hypothetical protein CYMTET_24649 [Cymbomonas tetramitiformis]
MVGDLFPRAQTRLSLRVAKGYPRLADVKSMCVGVIIGASALAAYQYHGAAREPHQNTTFNDVLPGTLHLQHLAAISRADASTAVRVGSNGGLAGSPAPAAAGPPVRMLTSNSISDAVDNAAPAVVNITTSTSMLGVLSGKASGSGFIIKVCRAILSSGAC